MNALVHKILLDGQSFSVLKNLYLSHTLDYRHSGTETFASHEKCRKLTAMIGKKQEKYEVKIKGMYSFEEKSNICVLGYVLLSRSSSLSMPPTHFFRLKIKQPADLKPLELYTALWPK